MNLVEVKELFTKMKEGTDINAEEYNELLKFFDLIKHYADLHGDGLSYLKLLIDKDIEIVKSRHINKNPVKMIDRSSKTYTVKENDTLVSISKDKCGDPNRWFELVLANLDKYPVSAKVGLFITPDDVLYLPLSWTGE